MRILQSKYSAEKLADALERMDDEAGSAHYIWGDGMFIYLHTIHTVEEKLLIRKYALWRLEGFSSGQRFVGSRQAAKDLHGLILKALAFNTTAGDAIIINPAQERICREVCGGTESGPVNVPEAGRELWEEYERASQAETSPDLCPGHTFRKPVPEEDE